MPKKPKRYEYNVAKMCERIHMSLNGSGDLLCPKRMKKYIATLQARIEGWIETYRPYDEAYRSLIVATIHEYQIVEGSRIEKNER